MGYSKVNESAGMKWLKETSQSDKKDDRGKDKKDK